MITTIVSSAGSLIVGLAIGVAAASHRMSKLRCVAVDALTVDDRDQIETEFAAHTAAANRALREFADELAGDDHELRNRLRHFETGRHP